MKSSTANTFLAVISSFALACVFNASAFGHFIWVGKSTENGQVQIFFGEGPHPDNAQFLAGIKHMQVWSTTSDGNTELIKFVLKKDDGEGWFETVSDSEQKQVDVDCQYGIFSRGDKRMLLHYCAKYCEFKPGLKTKSNKKLPVDITIASGDKSTTFVVFHENKPAAECEVEIIDDADKVHTLKTDATGKVNMESVPTNRWLVRAKIVDETAGTHDGENYIEKRNYCTLVLGLPKTLAGERKQLVSSEKAGEFKTVLKSSKPFPQLPVGITSFGGAVVGDYLYAFGGHCGEAHDYYESGQNGTMFRLNWKTPTKWEEFHEGGGVQGLAMVAHEGDLYRVGGFKARNEQGQDQDLHSISDFARFNFETNSWDALKPMPTPRSSLDAVVVGDKLFVIGGWIMKGSAPKVWCDNACWIDLRNKDSDWQILEVPFKRRALATGYQDDQLYVLGGMKEKGGPTRDVNVYNIRTGEWSDGPAIPGSGRMAGFGSSCFNIGGQLVVSTYGGEVLRLSENKDGWEQLHKLEAGRFFHRLLPLEQNKFVLVGGANMDIGKLLDLEVLEF